MRVCMSFRELAFICVCVFLSQYVYLLNIVSLFGDLICCFYVYVCVCLCKWLLSVWINGCVGR